MILFQRLFNIFWNHQNFACFKIFNIPIIYYAYNFFNNLFNIVLIIIKYQGWEVNRGNLPHKRHFYELLILLRINMLGGAYFGVTVSGDAGI